MTACYQKVVDLEPDNDVAHFNLAVALRKQEKISQALTACRRALQITPNFAEAGTYLLQLAQHACDWNLIDGLMPEIDRLTDQQIRQGIRPTESPMLSLRRSPTTQQTQAVDTPGQQVPIGLGMWPEKAAVFYADAASRQCIDCPGVSFVPI